MPGVAVAGLLPAGTPGGPSPAAAERLAVTAEPLPSDAIGPDEFRYVRLAESQLMEGDPGPTTIRRERWIAADGRSRQRSPRRQ